MPVDQELFTAFIENSDDVDVLHNVAKQLNLRNYEVITGGIQEAIKVYEGKKSPSYLIVDISKSELAISDMSRLIELCSPNVGIIAIGAKNEISLYRDLNKLGVYEYLLTPLFPEILERTLQSMVSGQNKVERSVKTGKIIACIGARGGVGTTFIASNLAAMLSEEKSRRVALIDLDPYFGTLSLNFDIKPSVGLRDALENPSRIDQVFIDRIITPINNHLFILASEEALQENIQYKTEGLELLLKFLTKQFHYVIVDVPHVFNSLTPTILLQSNILLLITEPSVASLRDTGRLMSFTHIGGNMHRSILVMNKQGQYGHNELSPNEFEAVLKNKVNHFISYDNVLPMEFLNQGKLMVNAENPIAESIRSIMFDILGTRQTKEKVGWFKKLF